MQAQPTIAMMYDFDKTLTTKDMQEYTFIPKLGLSSEEFWKKANDQARGEGMDSILSYLKLMLDEAKRCNQPIRRSDLVDLGRDLQFYPGVEGWFSSINAVGEELGLSIEHYIISSGLKEIIEGSAIGSAFRRIYACEYLYDAEGRAVWPKLSVNYTAKTQFLFRINKGVLDVYDDKALNAYTKESDRSVPFRNMIYIGDGLTDVPCMKLVKENGGMSIAVHAPHKLTACKQLMNENRINFYALADYRNDGELFTLVSTILQNMKSANMLQKWHSNQQSEARLLEP